MDVARMSLYDHLLQKPKEELAKLLAAEAKDNAALKEKVARLEVEIFWMKARERDADESPGGAPQAPD